MLLTMVAFVAAGSAAAVTASPQAATGTLNLNAELKLVSNLGGCSPPPGVDECAARTGEGRVPGLGTVTEAYAFLVNVGPPSCAAGFGRARSTSVRHVVATKGEIHFALADGGCVEQESIRTQTQTFTITGGTGVYEGASGSGTVERVLGAPTPTGRHGRETWRGTLVVPGLEFDLTPPTVTGAVAKTVRAPRRAKRARVSFSVTAQDTVDGTVAVSCTRRSRSWFRLGRTRVTCSATDSSANTRTVRFTITVRPRR